MEPIFAIHYAMCCSKTIFHVNSHDLYTVEKPEQKGIVLEVELRPLPVRIKPALPLSRGQFEKLNEPIFYIQSKLLYLSISPSATRQTSKINTLIIPPTTWTVVAEKASRRDDHFIAGNWFLDTTRIDIIAEYIVRQMNLRDLIELNYRLNVAIVMNGQRRMTWF